MDPTTGWCVGCARTIDEIASWSALDDDAKRGVWRDLPQRRQLAHALEAGGRQDLATSGLLQHRSARQ